MTTIQIKRGLEADRSSVTPAAGELLYTTDTKQVFVGDGSTAGGNPVAAGGAAIEATASGALANGDLVVVNSDGTVSVVAAVTQAVGTPVIFESATSIWCEAAYDSVNNKVVVVYGDGGNSNYGTAIVGTVSGTSISFGTPVVFNSSGTTVYISPIYDSANGKVVIAYRDGGNSNYGTAIVGTVSGTSISFGTAVVFESYNSTNYIAATYDSTNSKVVIAYQGTSSYGRAIVGTVSGTSISFGTAVNFDTSASTYVSATYDSANQKVVVAWNATTALLGRAIVGTVSGTSISFGSYVTFEASGRANYNSVTYDSAGGKIVIAYSDNSNLDYGTAIVGTVSGTSISFGTAVVFESATTTYIKAIYNGSKVFIAYTDGGNSNYGTAIVGTVSGTSISFDTPVVFETSSINSTGGTYDSSSGQIVLAYRDLGNLNYGTSVIFRTAGTNLTATNYIGISDGAYADTATATIQVKGSVDDAQSSLTAGQAYYVQGDGTLSTTPDSPSVLAGTAVLATEIIVKG